MHLYQCSLGEKCFVYILFTYMHACMHAPTCAHAHTQVYISWIHKLVRMTTGCRISHINTKHIENITEHTDKCKVNDQSCSETRIDSTHPCVRRVIISNCIREPVEVARVLEF
jgi:hypothetical protein